MKASNSRYPPSPRSRRLGRVPRYVPYGLGVVGLGNVFRLGVDVGVIVLIVSVLVGALVVVWLRDRDTRKMLGLESTGAWLAASGSAQVDRNGNLIDLNHRSAAEIALGSSGAETGVSGTFLAHADVFRFSITKSDRRRAPRDVGVRWDAVAGAEVVARRGPASTLFLHMRDGQRHRLDLVVASTLVEDLLEKCGVPAGPPPEDRAVAVGDEVSLRTGEICTVVAVVARPDEEGHAEVFVRTHDGAVESWDLAEVTPRPPAG